MKKEVRTQPLMIDIERSEPPLNKRNSEPAKPISNIIQEKTKKGIFIIRTLSNYSM